MRGKVLAGVLVPVVVAGGAGAYLWADAQDYVPGFITTAPEPVEPAPFLSAQPVTATAARADAVAGLDADAPVPAASAVQKLAQEVRADTRTGTSTNVSVVDLATGDVLADVAANETQVPASTTKLLTQIAAVTDLGPDFQMATSVTWEPNGRQLTLVAGGDMLLAADAGHGGAGESANGWAGLGDLADAVVAAVGEELAGDPGEEVSAIRLAVDDSWFEADARNPDWPQYAFDAGYVAAASGVAVDAARKTDEKYAQRYPDPSLHAAEVFGERLAERGVETREAVRAPSPAAAETVAEVKGAPLSLVSELVLAESDNTVAEIVSLVHAGMQGRPVTPTGAAQATIAALESIGAPTTGLRLYDGAGYSERNRISPTHLTGAIRAALASAPTAQLLDWLPVAGLEGTLARRYHDTDAAGLMRAKTGSLTGVTTLAGVVQTADGRMLAFAVLADGMPPGQPQPQAALDEFVNALAECGCES